MSVFKNFKQKNKICCKWVIILLAACLSFVFLALVMPLRTDTQLANGDLIQVRSPSALESFNVATCSIYIKTKSGTDARIKLSQSWYDLPFMVIPSTNPGVFYCLYDYDTDFQLLKIDTNRKFSQPPKNKVMSANILDSS